MTTRDYQSIKFCVKVNDWPAGTGVKEAVLSDEQCRQLHNKIVEWFCEVLPPGVVTATGSINLQLNVLVDSKE